MFLRKWREEKGQALVEMALILPVLLMIVLGIMEFGRVFNGYLVVTHAAREGARAGVVGMTDAEVVTAVKNAAATLDVTLLNTSITPNQYNRKRGDSLTVNVSYQVDIFAPVISSIVPDPFPIQGTAVMRVE